MKWDWGYHGSVGVVVYISCELNTFESIQLNRFLKLMEWRLNFQSVPQTKSV